MFDTIPLLAKSDFPAIWRAQLDTLQVNLGYLCNLSCVHCHVNAGPKRTELMQKSDIDLVLEVLQRREINTLDLTGGAPEMNPHFRYLVSAAREMNVQVIDRSNLTILLEPGYGGLAEFLAQQQVVVTASLPCYSEQNVDRQRGKGVFEHSIAALQLLNSLGYGKDEALPLHLVYNPIGASLPPPQGDLQIDYKKELHAQYDIVFNDLFTITNMPINRFGSMLISKGEFESYMQLLKSNYSESNLAAVMCKNLVSVDWQGYLYDCDFNQMLAMPLLSEPQLHELNTQQSQQRSHLRDMLQEDYSMNAIRTADHCYGCTAGQGSSCGGALSES
ncbi:MAG: arsenosugar biosynthesis radical SAM (seleno)protein ArsS [Pseudomonadales bacterium]